MGNSESKAIARIAKETVDQESAEEWGAEMKDYESDEMNKIPRMKGHTEGKTLSKDKKEHEVDVSVAEEAVHEARKAFLEGNRLFREVFI
jgi:hypothetical protein